MTAKIVVRCIACHKTQEVGPEQKDQPVCTNCWVPMIAERASHEHR